MRRRPRIDPRWTLVALLATRAVVLLVFLTGLSLREQATFSPPDERPPARSWLSSPPEPRLPAPTWELPAPTLVEAWCRRAAAAAEAAEADTARARRIAAGLLPEVALDREAFRLAEEAHRSAEAVAATAARALAAALIARSGYSTGLHDWSRWAADEAELERTRAARGLWDVQQLAFEARLRVHQD